MAHDDQPGISIVQDPSVLTPAQQELFEQMHAEMEADREAEEDTRAVS